MPQFRARREILVKVALEGGSTVTILAGRSGTQMWVDGQAALPSERDPAEYAVHGEGPGERGPFRLEWDKGRPVLLERERRHVLGESERTRWTAFGSMWAGFGCGAFGAGWFAAATGLHGLPVLGMASGWLILGLGMAVWTGARHRDEVIEWGSVVGSAALGLVAGAATAVVVGLLDWLLFARG